MGVAPRFGQSIGLEGGLPFRAVELAANAGKCNHDWSIWIWGLRGKIP